MSSGLAKALHAHEEAVEVQVEDGALGSYGVQVRDGHGVLIGSHRLLVAH
jgi:hypothetical protein